MLPSRFATLLFVCTVLICSSRSCDGAQAFGFDVHHLFSDPVRALLAADGFPEPGSLEYYVSMARRDRAFRRRHLAEASDRAPLTFLGGNTTFRADLLGHLHYVNMSMGTPSKSFIVALDTGSDLLWLPCDCVSCVRSLSLSPGEEIKFNIYRPAASSSSSAVQCRSPLCIEKQCSGTNDTCPYHVAYLSNGTSSAGTLVEDILHLVSEDVQASAVDARVTFGCGQIQTGSFLQGAALNGLFGLGMKNISVPSILANNGLVSNSFSMCFGFDGVGRITFGDEGSFDQGETPFNFYDLHPTYNVSITQMTVGENTTDVGFTSIFDTGTSYAYLNDPAYTLISESFNSQAEGERIKLDPDEPFNYCYALRLGQTKFTVPNVTLTMKGGKLFHIIQPIVLIGSPGRLLYCFGVSKSEDVNIIGQNFMTGYRVVFDRRRMILGWKESNCSESVSTNMVPVNRRNSTAHPPAVTFVPEATSGMPNSSQGSGGDSALASGSLMFSCALVSLVFSCFLVHL